MFGIEWLIGALIFTAAATGVGIYSNIQTAKRQQELAQAQADIQANTLELEAAAERENRVQEAMRQRKDARMKRATAEAQYAASGVAMEGTPAQALQSIAAKDEMETIMYESASRRKQDNYLRQAQNTRILGTAAADTAASAGTMGAIGAGLSGLASSARIGYEIGTKK